MQIKLINTDLRKLVVILCCATLVSCSSDDSGDGGSGVVPLATNDPFDGLRVVGDNAKFESEIREALLNSVGSNSAGGADGANNTDLVTSTPTTSDAAAAPQESQTAGASTESDASGLNVTGTNVQEIGVDEADRVKSDGRHLFVLENSFDQGTVSIDALEDESALTPRLSIALPPQNSKARIRMLSLDAESADASLVKELEFETNNEQANGLYLHDKGQTQSILVTSSSLSGYWGFWGQPYQWAGQSSTIRKINVTNPATASVVDSLKIDGQIVSSRRIGDYMYVASRYFPQLNKLDSSSGNSQSITDAINNADIQTLLPQVKRASDEQIQQLADANNCFVAEKPKSGYYSPDIITLAVIDIADMSVSDSVCYLGSTETLYASPNSIYLATTDWNSSIATDDLVVLPADSEPASLPISDPRTDTDIHQFDINAGQLTYRGSGSVEGHLGWNELRKPFRMSEYNGFLRVVTHDNNQDGSQSPVLVSILKPGENARLDLVARLPNTQRPEHIGKPREELYASRFRDDKAYLVTFRQTDPLYVVDLADPTSPFIAGELEIDGYSDYLGPVGKNHLLGVGKGAVPAASPFEGERGAFATGIKLSLFDVSDPASPKEVQSIEIGKRGSESEALRDHHGITLQIPTDGQPARLALGINVADINTGGNTGPQTWHQWRETGLFAFEISTDANAGINQHGSMIVESRSKNQEYGPRYHGDRSVLVNDAVFYIHGNQVYGANWNSLGNFNGPR